MFALGCFVLICVCVALFCFMCCACFRFALFAVFAVVLFLVCSCLLICCVWLLMFCVSGVFVHVPIRFGSVRFVWHGMLCSVLVCCVCFGWFGVVLFSLCSGWICFRCACVVVLFCFVYGVFIVVMLCFVLCCVVLCKCVVLACLVLLCAGLICAVMYWLCLCLVVWCCCFDWCVLVFVCCCCCCFLVGCRVCGLFCVVFVCVDLL